VKSGGCEGRERAAAEEGGETEHCLYDVCVDIVGVMGGEGKRREKWEVV